MTDHKLQVIPLGGLGEFGMNMTAIRFADDIIIVDCGMMFPDAELLGVDLVMPDLTYLRENLSSRAIQAKISSFVDMARRRSSATRTCSSS